MLSRLILTMILLFATGCAEAVLVKAADEAAAETVLETVPFVHGEYYLPGADLSIPDWAGKRADEPFDVKTFLMSRMPPAENAADLYIKAMAEFSSDFLYLHPQEEWELRRERYEKFAKQAYELNEIAELGLLADEATQQHFEQFLFEAQPYLGMIDEAQERSECLFVTGLSITAPLPHMQAARMVLQICLNDFTYRCSNGDFPAAEKSLTRLLKLSRDLQPRGGLIAFMVSEALENRMLYQVIICYLNHPDLTIEDCDRLLEILEGHSHNPINPFEEALKMEYLIWFNFYSQIESEDDGVSTLLSGVDQYDLITITFRRKKKSLITNSCIDMELERQAFNRVFSETLNATNQPMIALNHLHDESVSIRTAVSNEVNHVKGAWNLLLAKAGIRQYRVPILASEILPQLQSLQRCILLKTRVNAMCMLTAVKRYQLQNGELPETLKQAAVEAGFEGVLSDPFDGEPLRYVVRDGKAVIYSIGADMQDDGGVIDWDKGRQPGDILFPVP